MASERPTNVRVVLRSRPSGLPQDSDFALDSAPVPPLRDRQFLVRNEYLAMEPAMRGWLDAKDSYVSPVRVGDVMRGYTAGVVVESRSAAHPVGSRAQCLGGWQAYSVAHDRKAHPSIDALRVPDGVPPTWSLGLLSAPGLAAYFGVLRVARAAAGECVVVSAAAGATGSVACQIAKLRGCRVVGVAGGAEKCRWLTAELGVDAAVDYKAAGDLAAALRRACPRGIDVYFDNVGGATLDAALRCLNKRARVALCGAIASANDGRPAPLRNHMRLLVTSSRMEGFIVPQFAKEIPAARAELTRWAQEGRVTVRETVLDGGLDRAPAALRALFEGRNTGKLLLRLPPAAPTPAPGGTGAGSVRRAGL